MNRFIADHQFDNFRKICQLIVTTVPKWGKKVGVVQNSFKKDACNFLFKVVSRLINIIDPFGFVLHSGIIVHPFEYFVNSGLIVQRCQNSAVAFGMN
ncbi:Uncharacterised protein [Streptococcus pneumoniae]|nr:Uncharacterised protein [Streptococcus pneumoniae]